MANDPSQPSARDFSKQADGSHYEVGYKKPPAAHRFRKGQSGNPRGRPKGSKNKVPVMNEERLKQIVLEEAYRTIPIQDQGKQVTIPIAQAVVRSLAVNAAKGNTRAQKLFTELLSHTETTRMREQAALVEAAINFKVQWEREFDRCDRLGIPRPEPLPHPDHVIVDIRAGTVRIAGPATKEEKAELDICVAKLAELLADREALEKDLAATDDSSAREQLRVELEHVDKMIEIMRQIVPVQTSGF